MDALHGLRVVLAHDWLTGMRGGEKCLEAFCRLWPDAPLYTVVHKRGSVSPLIENRTVRTSWLQKLPASHRYYRYLLPFMPSAVNWTLPECDLVLSISTCVAKSVQPPPGVPHICYCNSPMRYAWHMRDSYGWRGIKGWMIDVLLNRIRAWDRRTAAHVSHFIANSNEIKQRIRDCYDRDSVVIYPPVDTDYYHPSMQPREDFYLAVSALAPYKRFDLAVEACNRLGKKLVVIGSGQELGKLKKLAGPTVHVLGWQPDEAIRDHMRRARALLFPGREDFGIVPVEAQACGLPVIALGQGGATETVVPLGGNAPPTGVWFPVQTVDCMIEAIERFEQHTADFDPLALRRNAERFNTQRYEREITDYVQEVTGRRTVSRAA
jgi:glycosyltransferase involved in cell wall biosynthesis